jgi:hypothetical protein
MKKFFIPLIVLLIGSASLQAQFIGQFAEVGFGLGRTSLTPFTFTNKPVSSAANSLLVLEPGEKAGAMMSFPHIGMEAYLKYIYFQFTFGLGMKHKVNNYDGLYIKDRDGFAFRLAGGFWIKNTVGLLAGFHIHSLRLDVSGQADSIASTSNPGDLTRTFYVPGVDGGMAGLNAHLMVSLMDDNLLLRASVFGGGVKEKKTVLGSGSYKEIAAYYSFNDEKTFGVFAKFNMLSRKMNAVGTESQSLSNNPILTNIPAYKANATWITIGLMLPGDIFGGAEARRSDVTIQ